jgi:tRNA(Ile)-lysidine synthetase-like protein
MEAHQNFYSILYSTDEPIHLLKDIRTFWEKNTDFWFSHAPIDSWPLIETTYENTLETNIALLLHYDQIYRHPNPRTVNKGAAFRFATHIALKMLHNGQYDSAAEWEKIFILLCLRHNSSLRLKELALTKALQLPEHSALQLRFLNATIWDIHTVKHTAGYTVEAQDAAQDAALHAHLLQPPHITGEDVGPIHDRLYSLFYSIMQTAPTVAVSISGGVDSMVAAQIAKEVCNNTGKSLILLHINYNNRDTCEKECDLLRSYAATLGVPLYIRTITEINRSRNSSFRALYEDITRRIRFSFYSWFNCPVILGHNLDDCFENVFTNLSKQIHFENLFGMRTSIVEQGVTVLRPMLEVKKRDILSFADHTGIPHLCDSTPAWSRRGQMRDILIPGISNFDSNILPGLQQFVQYTTFLEQQWENSFKAWIMALPRTPIKMPRDTFFATNCGNLNFWVRLWRALGLENRPSNKSFNNMIGLINKELYCTLNSHWAADIRADYIIIQNIV